MGTRRSRRAALLLCAFGLAVALLYPATPFGSHVLGAEDLLYLRPPLTEVMPAGLERPSNAFLADAVEVFRPDLRWARDTVRSGALPLWNADVFTGFPVLASQQTAILWPLNAGVFVLPFEDGAALAALLAIALAALGAYALARRTLRLDTAPAALAGVTYGLATYLVSWLEHPHHNAWAVMPWALVAVARVVDSTRARDVGWLAVAFALLAVAGHPQSALMAGTLALVFALYRLRSADRRWAALARIAGGVLLGVSAGAIVLVPFVELLGQSADTSRSSAPLPLSSLLSVTLPELWGRPDWAFEGSGPANYLERTFYVGVAPLVLATIAVTARRRRPGTWFFAAAGVACVAVAVDTPAASIAAHVPPFSMVALPRMLGPASLCLAMLAALGLEVLLRDPAALGRRAAAVAAAVLVAPLGWLVVHSPELRALPGSLGAFSPLGEAADQTHAGAGAALRWGLIALVVLAVLVLARRRPHIAAAALVAVTLIDLLGIGRGFHPAIERSLLAPRQTPGMQLALADQGSDRVLGDGEYLIPNVDARSGLRDARGHGLPVLRRVQRLYTAYGGFGFQATRYFADADDGGRLADAFGARILLTGYRDADPKIPGLQRLLEGPDERVYRNPSALSRAYLAWSWRTAPSEDAARDETVASTTAQLRERPVLEGAGPAPGSAAGEGGVEFLRDDDEHVSLRTTSDRPARLVLLDTFYPGWRATVDGRDVPIEAANSAFRAVAVPAGTSTIEFRYRPRSVLVGTIVSAIALAGIVALLLSPRRRAGLRGSRRRPPTP